MKALPLGISDFAQLIEGEYYYIDKSLFIKELIDSRVAVTLIPRPRRFGKTLNLSLLRYFFDKTEQKPHLFKGLEIEQYPEIMKHQGKYPVIFMTFKDVKENNWQSCYNKMTDLISKEYWRHRYLLTALELSPAERRDFENIISRTGEQEIYENSLKNLTSYLYTYHKVKPIVLIDEYDTPIQAGFIHKYYEQVIGLMRGFLGGGLKDNNSLELSVITGILRVAKESIFSGLNNLKVCTFMSDSYSNSFGLLENEVITLLSDCSLTASLNEVRSWYNGYQSGDHTVYNPWSIISFTESKGKFDQYWVNVSSNDLIKELLKKGDESLKEDFEVLLTGQSVRKELYENIVFPEVFTHKSAVWNFLLFSGYLTFRNRELKGDVLYADFTLPNGEVTAFFRQTILSWFEQGAAHKYYNYILQSLIAGDMETFEKTFSEFVLNAFSFFDQTEKEPEMVYHSFVLGMLVSLAPEYQVKSNRESGFGRYDVMIIPKDTQKLGIVIEFKKADGLTLEDAADKAIEQIKRKQYETELISQGIKNILLLGIAFEGKKVCIKSAFQF